MGGFTTEVCSFFRVNLGLTLFVEDEPLDGVVSVVLRPVRCEHFQRESDVHHFRVVTAPRVIRIWATEPKSGFSCNVTSLGAGHVVGCHCIQNLLYAIESVERTSQACVHRIGKTELARDDLDVHRNVRQQDMKKPPEV